MKKNVFRSIVNAKKVRYGSVSTAITVVVILAVVLVNTLFTAFAEKNMWYADMTDESIYTLSEPVKPILDGIEGEVVIIFGQPEDRLEANYGNLAQGDALAYVYTTARQMAAYSDHVKIECHNALTEPDFFEQFASTAATKPSETAVIVARKLENGAFGEYRIYGARDFYIFGSSNSEVYAYYGEMTFTSAILQTAYEIAPTVYFTKNHGEKVFDVTTTYTTIPEGYYLTRMFYEAGFDCKTINLAFEDLPADARMVVINQPTNDFTPAEIEKLSNYLDSNGTDSYYGSVFYVAAQDTVSRIVLPEEGEIGLGTVGEEIGMKNIEDFVSFWGGIGYDHKSEYLLDEGAAISASVEANAGRYFYAGIADTATAQSYFKVMTDPASAKVGVGNARPIVIDPRYATADGTREHYGYLRRTQAMIVASDDAKVGTEKAGGTPVLVMSSSMSAHAENVNFEDNSYYSHLIFCSSPDLVSNAYLSSANFMNEDALFSVIRASTKLQMPINIDFKKFNDYTLTITAKQARTTAILLCSIIPIIALSTFIVISVRRKNR